MADINDIITSEEADDIFKDSIAGVGNKDSLTPFAAGKVIISGALGFSGGSEYYQPPSDVPPVEVAYQFVESGKYSFTPDQIAATQHALALWSDVANLKFVQVNGPNDSPYSSYSESVPIRFANYEAPLASEAASAGSIVGFNLSVNNGSDVGLGQSGLTILIHETGHAIGLNHPGNYNAPSDDPATAFDERLNQPTYHPDRGYVEDSEQYTLMSYFGAEETGADHGSAVGATPLLHDITAAQLLYGANLQTRAGNTTYGFNSNAYGGGSEAFHINTPDQKVVFAIWDAGGTDTLNLSGYSDDQYINLAPGAFSNAGGLVANIAMAEAVDATGKIRGSEGFDESTIVNLVENAVGGSGNDFIVGNAARNILSGGAGNDTFIGREGNDTFAGGIGDDTFYVEQGDTVLEMATHGVRDPATGLLIHVDGGIDTIKTQMGIYSLRGTNVENLTFIDNDPFVTLDFEGMGNDLRNTITGSAGNDRLFGFGGNDVLEGGGGSDAHNGGADYDFASYEHAKSGVVVSLSSTVRQGEAVGDSFLSIEGLIGSGYVDELTGSGIANTLKGGAGNDTLSGLAGDDRLDGGAGADRMYGGANNDTYVVDDAGDRVFEVAGFGKNPGDPGGIDTVETSLAFYQMTARIENLVVTAKDGAEVHGNALANVITGGDGSDRISGGAGGDTLIGGAGFDHFIYAGAVAEIGVDTIFGGGADGAAYGSDDGLDFSGLIGSVTVDLAAGRFTATNGVTSVTSGPMHNVQDVVGTANADTISGNSDGNRLDGGAGADVLAGGDASDTYFIDDAGDQVIEKAGEGKMDVVLTTLATYTMAAEVEMLASGNIESGESLDFHGIGNDQNNAIYSGLGNDILEGGGGKDYLDGDAGELRGKSNDILIGGAGDDTLNVRNGMDTLVFGDGWGKDTVHGFTHGNDILDMRLVTGVASIDDLEISFLITTEATGTRISFDDNNWIDLIDVSSDTVTTADFWFAGKEDPRALTGDEGANELIGDLNDNTLLGMGGDDTLIGLAGADRLDGGTGVDTADYSASAAGVRIDLTAGTAFGGDAEGDTLIDIENLIGSAFGDTLAGGADRGKFLAGDGDDTLVGGSWFDWMEGGAGNDIITGTGGQTVQFGDAGDDVMQGSLDNTNYFAGGLGNDIMIGGNTTDYISDVDGGDDVMHGGGGADTLVDYYGANEMYGEDGDDFVSSVGSGSHLDGGAGNDYISVANGDYTLIGGAGNDTLEHSGRGHVSFSGGEGADTFTYRVFGNGPISYEVSDFEDGVDKILLWDNKYYGTVPFESLTIADSDAGAVISWNGTSEMTLLGVAADEITQADFLMA